MRTLFVALALTAAVASCTSAQAGATTVVAEYPYICSGALRDAELADLADGIVARSENFTVTQRDIDVQIGKLAGSARDQAQKYPIYTLEQLLTKRLMLIEAKEWAKANGRKESPDDQLVQNYLEAKTPKFEVSDKEAESFYKEHVNMFNGTPYDQIKDMVIYLVRDQKLTDAQDQLKGSAGKRHKIQVSASWMRLEHERWAKNPVEQARLSGKPTFVNFGVIGCCDTMNPITDALRSDYGDKLNVVFVHTGTNDVLSNLYGISTIPVQLLFDKEGKQLLRHQGFISEEEVLAKFAESGINLSKGN